MKENLLYEQSEQEANHKKQDLSDLEQVTPNKHSKPVRTHLDTKILASLNKRKLVKPL